MISKGLKVDEKNSFEIVMNRRECHMIIESQSDILNPLSLLAHNQITASQFIRRGLYPF